MCHCEVGIRTKVTLNGITDWVQNNPLVCIFLALLQLETQKFESPCDFYAVFESTVHLWRCRLAREYCQHRLMFKNKSNHHWHKRIASFSTKLFLFFIDNKNIIKRQKLTFWVHNLHAASNLELQPWCFLSPEDCSLPQGSPRRFCISFHEQHGTEGQAVSWIIPHLLPHILADLLTLQKIVCHIWTSGVTRWLPFQLNYRRWAVSHFYRVLQGPGLVFEGCLKNVFQFNATAWVNIA